MIFQIEVIDKPVPTHSLWATGLYEESAKLDLPPSIVACINKKRGSRVIEALISDNESTQTFVVARLGKESESTRSSREEAGILLKQKIDEHDCAEIILDTRHLGDDALDILVGMILGHYRFNRHKSFLDAASEPKLKSVLLLSNDAIKVKAKVKSILAVMEGVYYARSLTSEPPNVLFPTAYAQKLLELQSLGVQVEILKKEDLERMGFSALLAVGQGSQHPSAVVVLKWNGANTTESPLAFIGKGVCFDSGGLCLKKTEHQYAMKWDKAGAGVVAGLIKSLALIKAQVNVVGILGMVENMPDGAALKPGDVIKTMSGQTVEVVNTDAEGRLVLADCLWYAQRTYQPKVVIDLGTLTMETFATLGTAYAGLYCNNSALAQQLIASGNRTGDLLWELPMGPFFANQLASTVADMKNVGVDFWGENGAAAEFLKRFIMKPEDELCSPVPWAHLDISGVSWTQDHLPSSTKGVTGFGVRLLLDWVLTQQSESLS